MRCPCKNCEKRNEKCHAKCQDYKEWKSENDAKNKIEKQKREKVYLGFSTSSKRRT